MLGGWGCRTVSAVEMVYTHCIVGWVGLQDSECNRDTRTLYVGWVGLQDSECNRDTLYVGWVGLQDSELYVGWVGLQDIECNRDTLYVGGWGYRTVSASLEAHVYTCICSYNSILVYNVYNFSRFQLVDFGLAHLESERVKTSKEEGKFTVCLVE